MNQTDFPMIDSHVHISKPESLGFMRRYCTEQGFRGLNIACLSQSQQEHTQQNILAALFKLQDERFFAHGTLFYPTLPVSEGTAMPDFQAQAEDLFEIGLDGMKMLEGKPTMRKLIGLPLNDPLYDGYFAYLERTSRHVIWHVADPETFWFRETAPAFAFQFDWFYGDGTFATKEQLYAEVLDVLKRFPKLKITFAHFFFLSDFPDQAEELLRKFPGVALDITPGREMYENFTKRHSRWQAFFHDFSDRILLGTDMNDEEFQGSASTLVDTIRRFLSTPDTFENWQFPIRGLGLSAEDCARIGMTNFIERVGATPRRINRGALKAYIDRYAGDLAGMPLWPYIEAQRTSL